MIVKLTVTGALVVLVSVPLMLPVPVAAMPDTVAVLSLDHSNVVPGTFPLNRMVVMDAPEQIA